MNRTIRWGIFTNCLIRSYIAGIYWTLVTAGYLAWSFWSGEWNRTWIIWPVAGVLFGAVSGIAAMFRKK